MRISAGVQTCALPIYDEVDVEHRAVGEADALHPGAALDAHDADPEAHVDPVVAVEVGDDRAHGRAEPALEGHRQGLDEADLDAERSEERRVGKAGVRTGRSRWSPATEKKKKRN